MLAPHRTRAGVLLVVAQERDENGIALWRQPTPPRNGSATEVLRVAQTPLTDTNHRVPIVAWLPAQE